ncbi:MAG TPA: hypothetical protein VJB14_03365 [Planctomycetota bacterium]|nr:hypothetical protein [Planctomycetota bacterium]
MIKTFVSLLLVAALAQDDPIAAAAIKGFRHPWSEFGEGCTVTYRETIKRPEIDDGGNLVLKDVVSEMIWTVESTDGAKAVLKIASEGREAEVPHHFALPNWAKGKGERKADEEVVVGGVKVACRVTTIAVDADKDASQVTTIWQNPEMPGWAVRFLNETLVRGKRNTSEEELLLSAREKVKVGEQEVVCYVVQATTEVEGGARVVRKEWRSGEVPGVLVRQDMRHYRAGREIEAARSKKEVVSFRSRK